MELRLLLFVNTLDHFCPNSSFTEGTKATAQRNAKSRPKWRQFRGAALPVDCTIKKRSIFEGYVGSTPWGGSVTHENHIIILYTVHVTFLRLMLRWNRLRIGSDDQALGRGSKGEAGEGRLAVSWQSLSSWEHSGLEQMSFLLKITQVQRPTSGTSVNMAGGGANRSLHGEAVGQGEVY